MALCAALLVTACSGDDPDTETPTGEESDGPTGGQTDGPTDGQTDGTETASAGIAEALGTIGTEAPEWDQASGYWADTDHLASLLPDGPPSPTELDDADRQVLNLVYYSSSLLTMPAPQDDDGWWDQAQLPAVLVETDWSLRLTRFGDAPMTLWHGTDAWTTLEPTLTASDAWEVDATAEEPTATYVGDSPPLSISALSLTVLPEGDVVWQERDSAWRESINASPTLADVAEPGLLDCLADAHAVIFTIAPEGSTVGGWDGTAYAIAVQVTDPAEPTAWWCGSLPGGAEALAESGDIPVSELGRPAVTPGPLEALDPDTLRVPLEPLEGEPQHTVLTAIFNFPERTFPGY